MKKNKTQSPLKVNSIKFLKALKVKIAKSNPDIPDINNQRNSTNIRQDSKLGMA